MAEGAVFKMVDGEDIVSLRDLDGKTLKIHVGIDREVDPDPGITECTTTVVAGKDVETGKVYLLAHTWSYSYTVPPDAGRFFHPPGITISGEN